MQHFIFFMTIPNEKEPPRIESNQSSDIDFMTLYK